MSGTQLPQFNAQDLLDQILGAGKKLASDSKEQTSELTDKAKDIVMGVLRENKLVLETPPPQFIFSGFGDSSLDFEVRAFLKCFEDRVPTRHALHSEINKAFEKAGISIPFPQRDLHVITPPTDITTPKKKASQSKSKPKPA